MATEKMYAVYEKSCKIGYENRYSIKAGITIKDNIETSKLLGIFDNRNDAQDIINEKGSFIQETNSGFKIIE